ncbi:antitoxin MazE-like protein [Bosea vaviloviae]|nr:antitoxin MazE-like protein [Bosea vaviloviae]
MAAAAERMRDMRRRRREQGVREVRLLLPDMRSAEVRARIARQSAALDPADEAEALTWIESVSEFDNPDPSDEQ